MNEDLSVGSTYTASSNYISKLRRIFKIWTNIYWIVMMPMWRPFLLEEKF